MEVRAVTILAAAVASQSAVNAVAVFPLQPLVGWLWLLHAALVAVAIVKTDMHRFKRMG